MRVVVDADGALRLDDADDTGRFSVQAAGGADAAAAALHAAGDGGRADRPDHVLVRIAAVRRLAAGRVDEGWHDRFAGMLAYAGSKGWVGDDGESILAHVEPEGTTAR